MAGSKPSIVVRYVFAARMSTICHQCIAWTPMLVIPAGVTPTVS